MSYGVCKLPVDINKPLHEGQPTLDMELDSSNLNHIATA